MDLQQLLSDWGLKHITPDFIAAGISLSDFPTLKFDELKNIITSVHDFVYFFEKLEEWRKTNLGSYPEQIHHSEENDQNAVGFTASDDFRNCSLPNTTIIDLDSLISLPELNESLYKASSPVTVMQNQLPCTSSTVVTTVTSDENTLVQSTSKKLNLQELLKKDSEGKAILTVYGRTGYLTSRLRNLLVQKIIKSKQDKAFENILVGEELSEFRITTEEFVSWAKEIHELFPTESVATYYIPYTKVQGQRICASGKLWEHFHYVKTTLHKSGLLRNKRGNKKSTVQEDREEILEFTDDDVDKIDWLKTHIEPWSRVSEYWDKTHQIRRHNLMSDNTSVTDYMKMYRCLQQELGAELIYRDFEKLYPGKGQSLLNRWDAIRTRLVELLQGPRKPKGLDNELLIRKLEILTPERQDGLILYLLPTLVRATQVKYQPARKRRRVEDAESSCNGGAKAAGRNKRPSVLESQEAFVLHVHNAASVEPAIAARKEQLRQQGLTAQPQIVLVGPLDDVQASYVVVDDIRYATTSPLRALDLTFKLFYATDCQYPLQAFHIWLFIQKIGYDITNTGDKFGTNINSLIGEIFSSD